MKVAASQLESHLGRELAGIYLIAADEPLLVAEAGDAIRRKAIEQGFEDRSLYFVERGFRWDSLRGDADSLSLFAARRIVEVRMATPRPGDAGAKALRSLAEEQDPDRVVVIAIQSRLDASAAKSVWVKTIEKHGIVVDIRPVALGALPGFIAQRASRHGLNLSQDAAEFLAERAEGNLLAADQELMKLALMHDGERIDARVIVDSVASSARFDVFRLGDALIAGNLKRAMTVLEGLKSEGVAPPLVLWSIVREISMLAQLKHAVAKGSSIGDQMRRLRVWQSRQAAVRRAVDRYSDADLSRLIEQAAAVDRSVKGLDRMPVWEAIAGLVLSALAPRRFMPA